MALGFPPGPRALSPLLFFSSLGTDTFSNCLEDRGLGGGEGLLDLVSSFSLWGLLLLGSRDSKVHGLQ